MNDNVFAVHAASESIDLDVFADDATRLGDGLLKLADDLDVDLSDLAFIPNSLQK